MSSVVETILVLDFGSQYTQLIGRRIREANVYSEIVPFNTPLEDDPAASAERNHSVRRSGLGLREGRAGLRSANLRSGHSDSRRLLRNAADGQGTRRQGRSGSRARVRFARHRDRGAVLPPRRNEARLDEPWRPDSGTASRTSQVTARSDTAMAAMENPAQKIFGIQFHPEVTHTENGTALLRRFVFDICGCQGDWTIGSFIERAIERIREQVGDGRAHLRHQRRSGFDGGGNTGVARDRRPADRRVRQQRPAAKERIRKGSFDSSEQPAPECSRRRCVRPLSESAGRRDAIRKRSERSSATEFIRVFEEEAKTMGAVDFLVQGTVYPDVIESVSVKGPSQTIKSHHNVGGLPERMHLKLVEPCANCSRTKCGASG